jgi:hypothetical protein
MRSVRKRILRDLYEKEEERMMSKQTQPEPDYPTERLIASKTMSGYSRDAMTAALTAEHYTLTAAKAAMEAFLNGTE